MECNPKIRLACPFPYYWIARFGDGEEVAQYTEDGQEALYQEVLDRLASGKGLSFVELRPTIKGLPIFRQEIDSTWQRPVLFRRHFKTMGLLDDRLIKERVMFALGWQATIAGKNYKSITYIDVESGQVLITHRDW